MKNNNTPDIRFPGFTGDWKQCKLGECVNYIKGFAFKSEDYRSNGIRIVRVSDLSSNEIKSNNEKIFLDRKYEKEYKKYKLNIGDIIITTVGSRAEMKESAVGRPVIVNKENDGLLNQNLVKISPINGYDSYFIYANLLKETYTNYIASIERGNANQANIAINDLWQYKIYLASNEEQKKIGDLFKQLNNTIDFHQQELTTLKQTKQGFLQKMFPKEGDTVPEIRFPGFIDDWEQCKLGEFTSSFSGGTPSVNNRSYYGGNIPFIRSAEINSDSTELFLTEAGLEDSSAKMVSKGDILYAMYGATSGEVGRSKIDGAINQAILAIIPNSNNDSEFLSQWLRSQKEQIIRTYLQGGQGNLSGNIVKDLLVSKPNDIDEQTKIGNFFKQLDDTIALHQKELEILQETKKAFLQKMFI